MAFFYTGETVQKYVQIIEGFDREKKIIFYASLAHELTISIRYVWSDERLSDAEKIEAIKWINEIIHSVSSKIRIEAESADSWAEESFMQMVVGYCDRNTMTKFCVEYAYKSILG